MSEHWLHEGTQWRGLRTGTLLDLTGLIPYNTGLPRKVFADTSFWYQPLPDTTPLASNSAEMVDHLIAEGQAAFGSGSFPSWTINTDQYSPPIWITNNTMPLRDIAFAGSGTNSAFETAMTGVHIPDNAVHAAGTDKEVVFYNTDTDDYCELWLATKTGTSWSAQWGARVLNASQSDGVGVPGASGSGVVASGLLIEGGTIKAEEWAEGAITHACGIALTIGLINPTISAPAVRTDGQSQDANTWAEGQRMRLPASLDLSAYNFNPPTLVFARMCQEYGLIVWDRAGALSFRGENPLSLSPDPYARPSGVFGNAYNYDVLWGQGFGSHDPFPWAQLQALPVDWVPPG